MALRTIDKDSWLVNDVAVIQRTWSDTELAAPEYTFRGPEKAYYIVSKAPKPLPKHRPLEEDSQIERILHCEPYHNRKGIYNIGGVICTFTSNCSEKGAPEWSVLNWLNGKNLSFPIPKVLHHTCYPESDKSLVFTTVVPGHTLGLVWTVLEDRTKDYFVGQVAKFYKELAQFTSSHLGGIDGSPSQHHWMFTRTSWDSKLVKLSKAPSQEKLVSKCREMGMKCDKFHFANLGLCLGSIIVRTDRPDELNKAMDDPLYVPEEPLVGFTHFQKSGYVPLEWIATWAYDEVMWGQGVFERDFGMRLRKCLDDEGMPNVRDAWEKWYKRR